MEKKQDAIVEIYMRMKSGSSLDKAKQNTIWLEDLNDEDRYSIDISIDHVRTVMNLDDMETLKYLYEGIQMQRNEDKVPDKETKNKEKPDEFVKTFTKLRDVIDDILKAYENEDEKEMESAMGRLMFVLMQLDALK